MRVTFAKTRIVDDFRKGTKDEERFEAGKVYDLPEASALRWINRNIAAPAAAEDKKASKGKASAAADEETGA